jgi:flagellar basal-body rod modification protein FlgD
MESKDGVVNGGIGGFELSGPADEVNITIYDAAGTKVRSLSQSGLPAGIQDFTWDGTSDAGVPLAGGSYTFKVEATQGSNKVTTTALQGALVTGIVRGASGVSLQLANLSGDLGQVPVGEVQQIF